jgi:hypothetical protein
MNAEQMQLLQDRADISDVVIQYANAGDRLDRDQYRACFTDPVEIDFTSFSGGEPETMAVDNWVDRVWGLWPGFDATQHNSSNHAHTINGDEATCISYMVAEHIYAVDDGDSSITLGGYYTNSLIRTPEGWKICRCQLTVTWRRGNEELFALAGARALSGWTRPNPHS